MIDIRHTQPFKMPTHGASNGMNTLLIGDAVKAVELQEKAAAILTRNGLPPPGYTKRLAKYRAALAEQAARSTDSSDDKDTP